MQAFDKIDFVQYLTQDSIFTITTFLEFKDLIKLTQINQQYNLLFSKDEFWRRIYETQNVTCEMCPFISSEFIEINYNNLKNIEDTNDTRYMTKFVRKYDGNKIIQQLMVKYWNRAVFTIYHDDRNKTRSKAEFRYFPKLHSTNMLNTLATNEYYNNFIKQNKRCFIFIPHKYLEFSVFDGMYLFNKKNCFDKSRAIEILKKFLSMCYCVEIYENRTNGIISTKTNYEDMLDVVTLRSESHF